MSIFDKGDLKHELKHVNFEDCVDVEWFLYLFSLREFLYNPRFCRLQNGVSLQ
jgi:hypothetical protein